MEFEYRPESGKSEAQLTPEQQQQADYFRKSMLISVAVRGGLDLAFDDPEEFTGALFGTLNEEEEADFRKFLDQRIDDLDYTHEKLLYFLVEDEVFSEWVSAWFGNERVSLRLSEEGDQAMREIYSDIVERGVYQDIYDSAIRQAAPSDSHY